MGGEGRLGIHTTIKKFAYYTTTFKYKDYSKACQNINQNYVKPRYGQILLFTTVAYQSAIQYEYGGDGKLGTHEKAYVSLCQDED